MRIIAGRLGGRTFDAPTGFKTHPMSDKARGALFNTLGDIEGLVVLDAFAGSGAISLEAVSRGAKSSLAVDSDRQAQKIIAANIKKLDLSREVKLVAASMNAWLSTNKDALFDIVIADPPYTDLQPNIIQRIVSHVQPNGILVLSWPGSSGLPELPEVELIQRKEYGDMTLAFYRKIQ